MNRDTSVDKKKKDTSGGCVRVEKTETSGPFVSIVEYSLVLYIHWFSYNIFI